MGRKEQGEEGAGGGRIKGRKAGRRKEQGKERYGGGRSRPGRKRDLKMASE